MSEVISTSKNTALSVQLKLKKLTNVGDEGKQRLVERFVVEGNNDLQQKANAQLAFEFPVLGDSFQGAGACEITFVLMGFRRKVLQSEGRWVAEEAITWTTSVNIHAAPPAYFDVRWLILVMSAFRVSAVTATVTVTWP